jgi:hypothetical protein
LEKSEQKCISFIKLCSAGSGKLYAEIMKWKEKPMWGVKLEEAYQVFGKWDLELSDVE